jgi:hypothetical protein
MIRAFAKAVLIVPHTSVVRENRNPADEVIAELNPLSSQLNDGATRRCGKLNKPGSTADNGRASYPFSGMQSRPVKCSCQWKRRGIGEQGTAQSA